MGAGALTIRRQIKSITNTKKMTKAMEMVSASKMRRAVAAVMAARPYSANIAGIVACLSDSLDPKLHPLLQSRPLQRVGFIVISTNRGLCGGFNTVLMHTLNKEIAKVRAEGAQHTEVYTFGKRGREYCYRFGCEVEADFSKQDMTRSVMDIAPLVHSVVKKYTDGSLDRVVLLYTHFVSSVRQSAHATQLLPLSVEALSGEGKQSSNICEQYLFEPTDAHVISYILPRILEATVYQAVLESEASEHSARMLAMHNASEAATDLLGDLRLTYNQARQAGITQEIAEISSGKAALE